MIIVTSEMRELIFQIKVSPSEKRRWFRLAAMLAAKDGKRASVGGMIRELVAAKEAEIQSEVPVTQ